MIRIATFESATLAHLAQNRLLQSGIPSIVEESTQDTPWLFADRLGTGLLVETADYEAARTILAGQA